MSTKVTENCPSCGNTCFPTDKAVSYESSWGEFSVKIWRYVCNCGWVWANDRQREHNHEEYYKQRKLAKNHSGAWIY